MFNRFICVINTEPLSSSLPVIPISFQQVMQPSLHTLPYLPQFVRAAVCMQQVIVAPHNSSYRERMREGNLIYFMPIKPVELNWLGGGGVLLKPFFIFKNLPVDLQFIFLFIFFTCLILLAVEAGWGVSRHAFRQKVLKVQFKPKLKMHTFLTVSSFM